MNRFGVVLDCSFPRIYSCYSWYSWLKKENRGLGDACGDSAHFDGLLHELSNHPAVHNNQIPEIEDYLRRYFHDQGQTATIGAHAPIDDTPAIANGALH